MTTVEDLALRIARDDYDDRPTSGEIAEAVGYQLNNGTRRQHCRWPGETHYYSVPHFLGDPKFGALYVAEKHFGATGYAINARDKATGKMVSVTIYEEGHESTGIHKTVEKAATLALLGIVMRRLG